MCRKLHKAQMNKSSVKFLLVGFLVCFFLPFRAAGQYRIDTWTTENGLPQNSINGIVQTRDGYIWFGTNDGLVRFDGVRFKVFNKANSEGISNNRISGVMEDRSGRLWVGADDGSLFFYENGKFTVVVKPNDSKFNRRGRLVNDGFGSIAFYVYSERKTYHYRDGGLAPFQIAAAPPEKVILYRDHEGGFWFVESSTFFRVKDNQQQAFETNDNNLSADVFQDHFGNFWLAVASDKKEIYRIRNNQLQKIEIPTTRTFRITEDKTGNLWIGTFDRGFLRLAADKVNSNDIRAEDFEHYTVENGILSDKAGVVFADREGGVWIGTEKGLHRFSPQTVQMFSKKDGLAEDNIYPILEDRAGTIWLGAWTKSLIKYRNGVFTTFLDRPEITYYSSLFEDTDGKFWFGNDSSIFNLENGKPVKVNDKTGFQAAIFYAISQDKDGNMWFGTNKGLSRYADGTATVFTTKEGLPDDFVSAILQTREGKIWVGTRGGVAVAQLESKGAVEWKSLTEKDGLASNFTRSLYEDSDGAIWIGSYDGGLSRYKDGKFTRYGTKDGLHSSGVFCILEDSRGWFWMNSNQGIYRVRKQELNDFADGKTKFLTSIAYGKQDGLLNIEGNGGRQPAGIKARDGKLWFPMAQGVAVVDPETVIPNPLPPPVLIEEVSIERNLVDNETFQSAIGSVNSTITLNPGQNNLEIRYTGLSFINSEQVKFRYRLEGLEENWTEAGTRRTAYFSYLPPGEYVFKVLAANRDGVWNEQGATVKIIVTPAYYQTWWFWILSAAAVALIIRFVYGYRLAQLEKINAAKTAFARQLIEQQEEERKRVAGELHDGLGQSLLVIKNRASLGKMLLDDRDESEKQLDQISTASVQAIEEVRQIAYNLRPYHLDRLGLTQSIEAMIEKIEETTAIEFNLHIANLDGVFSNEQEVVIYRIVQESISNIVKHSKATIASVEIQADNSEIAINIRDNGQGFAPTESKAPNKGGFGLIGLKERVIMLRGNFQIETNKGKGTSVFVKIPLPTKDV